MARKWVCEPPTMRINALDPMRIALIFGMLFWALGVSAQNAFSDSLSHAAERLRDRAVVNNKLRVAVVEMLAPAGDIPASTLTYIEETLIARLVQAGGVMVLERRQLGMVQEEQRRSASGTFDERAAVELGRLMAADAIVTGRVFQVDKKMHLMLRLLDTSTGVLLGSVETFTSFPKGKEVDPKAAKAPAIPRGTQEPVRMKRDVRGSERASIVELRALGLGSSYFGQFHPGLAMEIAVRAREHDQGVAVPGKVALGVQLGYWPSMVNVPDVQFDIGHIVDIRRTEGFNSFQQVRFGTTDMGPGRLFLMSRGPETVFIEPVYGPEVIGTELLEYDRYRLSGVRMDMANFNIPVRWYLSGNHMYDNVLKLYAELGFGMDMVRTHAIYDVTKTLIRLDRTDYHYDKQVTRFATTKPSLSGGATNMWFTHLSFGGGLEIGRFNFFATGRWYISAEFTELGESYQRVRGNILAYPLLVGAQNDQRTMNELERDGAVPFGATDLERMSSDGSAGTGSTSTGNGVDRFWEKRHFIFGLSFRIL